MQESKKATFIKKIRCLNPDHTDSNPSCALYEDGSAYCFVCNLYFTNAGEPVQAKPKPAENLDEKLEYIKTLPKTLIRGLEFPYDNSGYYVVWPTGNYYKLRSWVSDTDRSRYLCPSGHSKPLFVIYKKSTTLVIVEGEINALSLATADLPCTIMSPGGVGNFNDSMMVNSLTDICAYASIIICVDSDAPGLEAAIKLKNKLFQMNCNNVVVHLLETDFNDLLVNHAKTFKEQVKEELGL